MDAASHIYSELDGTELERSANVLDLSFVPDDMTFDDDCRYAFLLFHFGPDIHPIIVGTKQLVIEALFIKELIL